tara:strand:+ start:4751 stop:6343 length:1593 start_codon:yes stop_codon:yes gene_type:complete
MAINLGLNIKTNTKSSHTVNIVASSGITLATVNSSTKRLTGSATEDVIKEICTITFTANDNFYYSKAPDFKFNFNNGDLIVTSTTIENSSERITQKVFTISAKASVSTIYNNVIFNETISSDEPVGVNNTNIKEISKVSLDTSDVPPDGQVKNVIVNGTKDSEFIIVCKRSSDNFSYDFTSNTFTNTSTSVTKSINSSGVESTSIVIPSSSSLVSYTMQVTVPSDSLTILPSSLANTFNFNQLNNVSVRFACASADSSYSGTHGSLPSTTTITGINSSFSNQNTFLQLQPKLNTKAFKKAKEISLTDFEIRTTSTTSGGNTNTASVTLSSSNSEILVGMTVTGTGISNDVTVADISGTSLTLSGVPGGTINEGVTLTFIGAGPQFIQQSTGLVFSITDIVADSSNIATFSIADVNKKINADSSSTATVTLATNTELDDAVGSVVGIYEGVSTVKNGANIEGFTANTVNSSNNTSVLSSSATVKSGQIVTFENAGRVANISFLLNIIQFPTKNTILSLNLDNILTIDPNWS